MSRKPALTWFRIRGSHDVIVSKGEFLRELEAVDGVSLLGDQQVVEPQSHLTGGTWSQHGELRPTTAALQHGAALTERGTKWQLHQRATRTKTTEPSPRIRFHHTFFFLFFVAVVRFCERDFFIARSYFLLARCTRRREAINGDTCGIQGCNKGWRCWSEIWSQSVGNSSSQLD